MLIISYDTAGGRMRHSKLKMRQPIRQLTHLRVVHLWTRDISRSLSCPLPAVSRVALRAQAQSTPLHRTSLPVR